jgi:hypothetical protein
LAKAGKTKYIELNGEGSISSIKETLLSQLALRPADLPCLAPPAVRQGSFFAPGESIPGFSAVFSVTLCIF